MRHNEDGIMGTGSSVEALRLHFRVLGSSSRVIAMRWGRSRAALEARGGRLGEVEDGRGQGCSVQLLLP
jgi:hypothetical protein